MPFDQTLSGGSFVLDVLLQLHKETIRRITDVTVSVGGFRNRVATMEVDWACNGVETCKNVVRLVVSDGAAAAAADDDK